MIQTVVQSILQAAEAAGLLGGAKTAQISIRTSEALLSAAKQQTGLDSTTAVVELALASLALPDPVAAYMDDTFGALGADHQLEL